MARCARCEAAGDVMCLQLSGKLVLSLSQKMELTVHNRDLLAETLVLVTADIAKSRSHIDSLVERVLLYSAVLGGAAAYLGNPDAAVPALPHARA